MTRKVRRANSPAKQQKSAGSEKPRPDVWRLEEAKAKFSELVRRVKSDGPQHVTLHGIEAVVVVSAEEFHRLKGELSGQALIEVMQSSPAAEIELGHAGVRSVVRDIRL